MQAQHASLARVGRGGLGEDSGLGDAEAPMNGLANSRRGEATGVAHADVVHAPSEAEQLLKLLLAQLRGLRDLPKDARESFQYFSTA